MSTEVSVDIVRNYLVNYLRRKANERIRAAQECSKVAFGCTEVASELVRDKFEFFDLLFLGKEIIMRKYYFWKK